MARTPKPSGTRKSGPRGRTRNPRRTERRRRFLIVTEGEITEPQYFERLQQNLPTDRDYNLVIRPKPKGKGIGTWESSPEAVVKKCLDYKTKDEKEHAEDKSGDRMPYEECFAVVDVDQWDTVASGKTTSVLKRAIELAEENGINLVISNIKFEAWLLWHACDHSETDSKKLDQRCEENKLLDGKKLTTSFPIDKYPEATKRARECHKTDLSKKGPCPSSAVPALLKVVGVIPEI
ncbi:hypothetical protein CCYS_13135 [Corynebacterium cystitidis DSM 20524]|uniref:RloB-like protein n=1 Tax=Corynebacterium cystitidis DSM 20524 TaxID=1121357 RepID=A0A1H9TAV9_9CORY|nr:RloB family protein [Corynebacterium cystitidis]WJY83511.1 hypothetical protein CCYS_13135 [Corynebacterium cystitidis DSM 20524]SER93763.1 RloB-like protein [Corynebacterium cystitidis DSM 20524]SNV92394.1 Uncharacterised protein [Corynebacterium cystitidis]